MRLDYRKVWPPAMEAMQGLQATVDRSRLEEELVELVKIRASQINGCAYCVDMHTKDAWAIGVSPQKLHLIAVWREAPVFSPRERAAIGWCESLTLVSQSGAPDDVYDEIKAHFTEEERVALTLAIVAINAWNRLAIGFRSPVGQYVSRRQPDATRTSS